MSELTAQLALFGAIDAGLARDVVAIDAAADMIGAYRLEGTVGWYPTLVELFVVEVPGQDPTIGPSDLGRAALAELAGTPLDEQPEIAAVHGARRLRALHAYARLVGVDDVKDEFLGAVSRLGEIGEPTGRDDGGLAELLVVASSTEVLLGRVEAAGRLDRRVIAGAAVPCAEELRLVEVPDHGAPVDAACITLRAEVPGTFTADPATVETLRHAVHPSQWPQRLPWFWRDMVRRGGRRLHEGEFDSVGEVFSYEEFMGDFRPPSHADWYHPTLRFTTSGSPDGFELYYDLDRALNTEPKVLHDAGYLRISVLPDRVTATMVKEVVLDRRLLSAAAAIITCASGATDLLRAMATGAIGLLP